MRLLAVPHRERGPRVRPPDGPPHPLDSSSHRRARRPGRMPPRGARRRAVRAGPVPRRPARVRLLRGVAGRPERRWRAALPPGDRDRARRQRLRRRPGLARRPGLHAAGPVPPHRRRRRPASRRAERGRRARRGRRRLAHRRRRAQPHRPVQPGWRADEQLGLDGQRRRPVPLRRRPGQRRGRGRRARDVERPPLRRRLGQQPHPALHGGGHAGVGDPAARHALAPEGPGREGHAAVHRRRPAPPHPRDGHGRQGHPQLRRVGHRAGPAQLPLRRRGRPRRAHLRRRQPQPPDPALQHRVDRLRVQGAVGLVRPWPGAARVRARDRDGPLGQRLRRQHGRRPRRRLRPQRAAAALLRDVRAARRGSSTPRPASPRTPTASAP